MTASDLLPQNATGFERALLDAMASADPLAVPIRELFDPETCPTPHLSFLAWALSVDVWNKDWPEATKRAVIAAAVSDHRIKGTVAGYEHYAKYAGGDVLGYVAPPQAFFLGGGNDDPLWRAWFLRLPEIRLYTDRQVSSAVGFTVAGGEVPNMPEGFLGAEADGEPTLFLDGPGLVVERASIVDADGERPVDFIRRPDPRYGRDGSIVDFLLPGIAGVGLFLDDAESADCFLDGASYGGNVASVAMFDGGAPAGENWNLIIPGPYIQDVVPEVLTVIEDGRGEAIVGEPPEGLFLTVPDLDRATYRSLRLLDDGAPQSPATSFLNADRLAIPPYTIELITSILEPALPGGIYLADGFLDDGHALAATDRTVLDRVCDAVAVAKPARDTVLIDLDPPYRRTLGAAKSLSELSLR